MIIAKAAADDAAREAAMASAKSELSQRAMVVLSTITTRKMYNNDIPSAEAEVAHDQREAGKVMETDQSNTMGIVARYEAMAQLAKR